MIKELSVFELLKFDCILVCRDERVKGTGYSNIFLHFIKGRHLLRLFVCFPAHQPLLKRGILKTKKKNKTKKTTKKKNKKKKKKKKTKGAYSFITITCLYNFDSLKPHFYILKLGFIWVYINFLISVQMFWAEIWRVSEFLPESFHFLVVKFSV